MPPRLPPAFDVFPTLQRFAAMRPRRLLEVPIGCRRTIDSEEMLKQSALHLYHDLGVLVFAGCSRAQVSLIGGVLRQVVAWGGPGGVVALLDGWEQTSSRTREPPLGDGDVHEAFGEKGAGVIKSEALLRLANSRFQEALQGKLAELSPEVKDVRIRETQVVIPGSPPPRGIIHQTVSGPRPLPLESFTSLGVDRVHGHIIGEARFFTVGMGDYVGAARIHYLMRLYDEASKMEKPFWCHGKLQRRRRTDPAVQRETLAQVLTTVMKPLWQLEREIWANKADELVRSREKEDLEETW